MGHVGGGFMIFSTLFDCLFVPSFVCLFSLSNCLPLVSVYSSLFFLFGFVSRSLVS